MANRFSASSNAVQTSQYFLQNARTDEIWYSQIISHTCEALMLTPLSKQGAIRGCVTQRE
jgi:hypothetical protein